MSLNGTKGLDTTTPDALKELYAQTIIDTCVAPPGIGGFMVNPVAMDFLVQNLIEHGLNKDKYGNDLDLLIVSVRGFNSRHPQLGMAMIQILINSLEYEKPLFFRFRRRRNWRMAVDRLREMRRFGWRGSWYDYFFDSTSGPAGSDSPADDSTRPSVETEDNSAETEDNSAKTEDDSAESSLAGSSAGSQTCSARPQPCNSQDLQNQRCTLPYSHGRVHRPPRQPHGHRLRCPPRGVGLGVGLGFGGASSRPP